MPYAISPQVILFNWLQLLRTASATDAFICQSCCPDEALQGISSMSSCLSTSNDESLYLLQLNARQLSNGSVTVGRNIEVSQELLGKLGQNFDFKKFVVATRNPHIFTMVVTPYRVMLDFMAFVGEEVKVENGKSVTLKQLDVGGNSNKWYEREMATMTEYTSLDIVKDVGGGGKPSIVGNILNHNPNIPDGSFHIVSALNTFEHLVAPWRAAEEMVRIAVNGGFLIVIVPFSWRYHAFPLDTLRYTHTELRYLFESVGGVRTLFTGYYNYGPSPDGRYEDKTDALPDDNIQSQVEILWIGRKLAGVTFDPESLAHADFGTSVAIGLPN